MKPKQETSGRREGMCDCGYGGLGERKSFFSFNKQIEEKLKKMCDPIHRIQCIIRPIHSINQVAPNCYSKWSTGEGFSRTLTLESTYLNTLKILRNDIFTTIFRQLLRQFSLYLLLSQMLFRNICTNIISQNP